MGKRIEFNYRETGWGNAHRPLEMWPDCDWINQYVGEELYRLVEVEE